MVTLKELQTNIFGMVNLSLIFFSKIKDLPNKKIDMKVYLPSINMYLQRDNAWSLIQKRNLIMSIFINRYIPPIHLINISHKNNLPEKYKYQIIDGKQRLISILEFLDNKFQISIDDELYYLKELPKEFQDHFNNYNIKAQITYEDYNNPIDDIIKIKWFENVNFFNKPQDIVHFKNIIETYKIKNNEYK